MEALPSVFVVDDDPNVRESLSAVVRAQGLQVQAYASAEDFLAVYDPDQPGCVLVDIRMPGMSGLQLQEKLSAELHCPPIIILPGHADVPTTVRVFRAGAFDLLEKPVRNEHLIIRVQQAIKHDARARRRRASVPAVAARLAKLTGRERDIMDLLVDGRSIKQIATELSITTQTAGKHRAKILEKMNVDNDVELVRLIHLK